MRAGMPGVGGCESVRWLCALPPTRARTPPTMSGAQGCRRACARVCAHAARGCAQRPSRLHPCAHPPRSHQRMHARLRACMHACVATAACPHLGVVLGVARVQGDLLEVQLAPQVDRGHHILRGRGREQLKVACTRARTHACTHRHTCTHAHACAHTRTHVHPRAHARMHAHARTHPRTRMPHPHVYLQRGDDPRGVLCAVHHRCLGRHQAGGRGGAGLVRHG